MTQEENRELRSLLEDESILIKPVDKASSIVIMDRIAYVKEMEQQLSDRDTYFSEPYYQN